MNKPRAGAIIATLLAIAFLGGCSTSIPVGTATTTPAAPDFPVTVGTLTLAARPTHIVSLSPTATEMLFAIDAGSQVVAVDTDSTYPTNAPMSKLSGYQPNAEAIAAYSPDLVVISNDMEKIVGQLATLKIPTYVAPAAATLDDTYSQLGALGALTGHKVKAATVADKVRGDISSIVTGLPKHNALTYYYELDPTFYSVTSKTFVGSLFTSMGLTNIADASATAGNEYPQLSVESIVKASPDLIFLADTKCCAQSAATVGKRPGWSTITAVHTGQVIALDDDIASRWGPRVVDLVRAIATAVAGAPVG